ncbi:MAG: phosphoribosylaminoimidazolesuccinocarboxamide synthase [Pseudomonadota bacterium]|nr:phosphoribosylaminoimidazolesuccinocarboxamide synthase [Pseudomonadota bacterium]
MEIDHLKCLHRGKVRDLFEVDDEHMLIVTSDRISAFDVILPTPIPGKGEVLTEISNFWFDRMRDLAPNHLSDVPLDSVIKDPRMRRVLASRSVIVRRLKSLPVEAIVRGYLIGSGWKDYQREGSVCGISLAGGLQLADRLPEPLFTPSTKAEVGDYDINIGFDETVRLVGAATAGRIRDLSLEIYRRAAEYALERGIIIADTKFEFGLDDDGEVVLIDEVLTPDSSRFWPVDQYRPGISPPSFDKQFVRDYLETLNWDKRAPGPELPDDIVKKTGEKYRQALALLTARHAGDA